MGLLAARRRHWCVRPQLSRVYVLTARREGHVRAVTCWLRRYRAQPRDLRPDKVEGCPCEGCYEVLESQAQSQESERAVAGAWGALSLYHAIYNHR